MRTRFCESYFLGKGFRKTSATNFLKFGGNSFWVSARRRGLGRNARFQKYKCNGFKIVSVISFAMYCPCLKRCTLGIRLGHFRYGYSRLGASVRALARASQGEEVSSPWVGRYVFLVPRNTRPRHTLSTLFI